MSKCAVLLLPFFIGSLITVEPLISQSFTDYTLVNSGFNIVNDRFQNQGVELLAKNCPRTTIASGYASEEKEPKVMKVLITAYSSSIDETDNTPLITASGNYVRPGVAAANFLAFGTKVRLPKIFGNQIFIVEDRLHEKNNDRVDIWFPSKEEALRFGSQISEMEIL